MTGDRNVTLRTLPGIRFGPTGIDIRTIYLGVVPFILLQLPGFALIFAWDPLATWLPAQAYS